MDCTDKLLVDSKTVYDNLNDKQKLVSDECVKKKRGWMFLGLGDGKTRTSFSVALRNGKKTIIVASNDLIVNYLKEIEKVLGTTKYVTLIDRVSAKKLVSWNANKSKNPYDIVIVSISILTTFYKKVSPNYKDVVSYTILDDWRRATTYYTAEKPISEVVYGPASIYSTTWDTLIMDEFCDYINIEADRTRALAGISAINRWGLSGTVMQNPKISCAMGLIKVLGIEGLPNTIEQLKTYVSSDDFKGFGIYTVTMPSSNKAEKPYKIIKQIITHGLTTEEAKVYTMFKNMMIEMGKKLKEGSKEERIILNANYLSMITYMTQALNCPLLPITSIVLNNMDATGKSRLSMELSLQLGKIGLTDWVNNVDSAFSSRYRAISEVLGKHSGERCILYFSYRKSANLFAHLLGTITDRPIFTISPKLTPVARDGIKKSFESSLNGVLILTYKLGAKGHNLQAQRIMLLGDFDFTKQNTDQAIGRIDRNGQQHEELLIYYFSSNTSIENSVLQKQSNKVVLSEEYMNDSIKSKLTVKGMIANICTLIALEDNIKLIDSLYIK